MKKSQLLIAAGAAMGLSAAAMAQTADYSIWGGGVRDHPGHLVGGPIDLDTATGNTGNLGIVYLDGFYTSTSRVIPLVGGRANRIYRFDSTGNLVSDVEQISGAISDAWGYRDGATDGTSLYFGWGGGIARHDPDGSNGMLFIAGAAPGGVGTWRALAYDADLDGGAGGFWTQSFASNLISVDMNGTLIDQFAADGTSLYGLAIADGRMFGHSTGGDVFEISRVDGSNLGLVFNTSSAYTSFAAQGGLSEVPGGGFGSGNAWDLVGLGQGTPDEFAVFELVPAPGALALLGIGGLLMTRRRR